MNIQTNTASSTINTFTYALPDIDEFVTDMDRPEPYKDILKWMVLHELREKIGCPTVPLRILDFPLPSGRVSEPYSSSFYAAGGVPFSDGLGDTDIAFDYQWCVETSAPGGLTYTCDTTSGDLAASATCDSTGIWQQCTNPVLSGTPTGSSAMKLKVFVRDDRNNFADLTFGLVINQVSGLGICPEYRVWNVSSDSFSDYEIRTLNCFIDPPINVAIGGSCQKVPNAGEITGVIRPLKTDEVLCDLDTSNGTCGGYDASLAYNQAIMADVNGDCCIYYDKVDRVCP
jgi:hypothetical protein